MRPRGSGECRRVWTEFRFSPVAASILLLAACLLAAPEKVLGQGDDSTGTVTGTVRITEKLTAQRMRFRLYAKAKPALPQARPGLRADEYRNVVIYLKPGEPSELRADGSGRVFSMAQEGETFIPHVLPVMTGDTVEFPNFDPIFHNVFSLSSTRTFDLGRYPQGASKSVTFEEPGIVPVFCHIHSDMSAIILVLDNPWYAVPDADGHFSITGLPAGSHTLVAWHERAEPVETRIEVKEGQTLEIDLTVPIEDDDISRP